MLVSTLGFFFLFLIHTCGADVPQEAGGEGGRTERKRKCNAYPARPIPLGHLCITRVYPTAHVYNVALAGRHVDFLMQARVSVYTLDAKFARGVRVCRVDRAAGIECGFKVRLVRHGFR